MVFLDPCLQNKIMELKIDINEQMLSNIVTAVVKTLTQSTQSVQNVAQQEVESLQNQVASLQKELAQMKAQAKQTAQTIEAQKPTQSVVVPRQPKPNGKSNGSHSNQPDAEKAERWVRENLEKWLELPCNFAKAQGRTWKELSTNQGAKIVVKGKEADPRAYLHALQSWETCNMWERMKAKVALEFGKNGSGSQAEN